ncbi:MAG TPA: SpoIIE family protein phosphatase [Candidatus Eisenbacteria bacterium]|nr:SpoIIE family protein phosphatase [Candidatus Eisenbacteria bacterium]
MEHLTLPGVEWSVASRALELDTSGDAHIVRADRDRLLLGVVDALGHGPAAAATTDRALAVLERAAFEDLASVVRRCHEELRSTRGAVLTLVWIDRVRDRMSWVAVGDIQGLVRRDRATGMRLDLLIGRGGVVGRHLPPLVAGVAPIAPGDLLVLATDGIRPGYAQWLSRSETTQRVADAIMGGFRTGRDDALVLVARYHGMAA